MKKAKMPALCDLMADLEQAKQIAIRNENANSLVTATMAQAKLLGYDKPAPAINDEVLSLSALIDEISLESQSLVN